jgi:hypothetical protein
MGRKVTSLVNEEKPAGHHQAIWHADDIASGIYFYRLKSDDYTRTKRMILLK